MIGMIWAQAADRVIGARNTVPWHVPEDFGHFREVTLGTTVVMGRATWDSLPPRFRPMPGRRNIVLTRDPQWSAEGAERAGGVEEALALAAEDPEVWIMGGAQVYAAAMPYADTLVVSDIDLVVEVEPGEPLARAPRIGPEWHVREGRWDGSWQLSRTGVRWRVREHGRT